MNLKDTVTGALNGTTANVSSTDLSAIVANLLPNSGTSLEEALGSVTKGLEGLTAVSLTQSDVVGSNTQAVLQNTAAQSSGGLKGAASTIGKAASSILTSGLGMMPVVSAIRSLFSGGKSEPAPLAKYTAPPPIRIDGTVASGWGPVSLGGSTETGTGSQTITERSSLSTAPANPVSTPQITIQVQAMDSRSFMDRSGDIAQAVREAMLNLHSLNDVINDA